MVDLAKELEFIEDMEKFKSQMNPRCIVCGDLIQIVHKVQMKKKYCGYPCQQKAARERKKNVKAELLQSV